MRRALCLTLIAGAALLPARALAQGGVPDPAFASGGIATVSTAPAGEREMANAMAVDREDRVLVGGIVNNNDPTDPDGGWMLVRFRGDGSLDTGFGEGGLARAPGLFGPNLADFGQRINALAIAPGTDKVIAGGTSIGASANTEFTVARYDSEGDLDMTFGPADTGFVRVDISSGIDTIEDIAVAPDGSITAVGSAGLDTGLARWNSDGALDPTFDGPGGLGNGAFADSAGAGFDSFRSVELDASGEVLAVGTTSAGPVSSWLIGRYTQTGARDPAFNGTGLRTVSFGGQSNVAAAQALVGGTLFVFGPADVDPDPKKTVLHVGVDAFQASTGTEIPDAKTVVPLPESRNVFNVVLQRLGDIQGPSAERFVVVGNGSTLIRLRRAGSDSSTLELDPEFGSGGFVPDLPATGALWGAAIDSDNRLVVGGEVGLYTTADFAAARFLDVPSRDGEGQGQGERRDATAPVITDASVAPRAWALNPRGTVEALLSKKKKKVRRGTEVRYTLSEPARVVIAIERKKVKRRKKPPRRAISFVPVGSFAEAGSAGANRNPFSGMIGTKRLRPGNYRAVLVASDPTGNASAPTRLAFRLLSRGP